MKKIFLVLLTILFLFAVFFMKETQKVYMAPHIDKYLTEITENFPNETLACLDYVKVNDHLVIYDYEMPTTYYTKRNKVYGDACSPEQITFHNHPHQDIETNLFLKKFYYAVTGDTLRSSSQMLYLSRADIKKGVANENEYNMVGADGEYAWWSKEQVNKAFYEGRMILKIIGAQSSLYEN